jgi:hypothetical protein
MDFRIFFSFFQKRKFWFILKLGKEKRIGTVDADHHLSLNWSLPSVCVRWRKSSLLKCGRKDQVVKLEFRTPIPVGSTSHDFQQTSREKRNLARHTPRKLNMTKLEIISKKWLWEGWWTTCRRRNYPKRRTQWSFYSILDTVQATEMPWYYPLDANSLVQILMRPVVDKKDWSFSPGT